MFTQRPLLLNFQKYREQCPELVLPSPVTPISYIGYFCPSPKQIAKQVSCCVHQRASVSNNARVENIFGELGTCREVYKIWYIWRARNLRRGIRYAPRERESRRGQAPAQLRVQQSLKLQSMKKNNQERHNCFHFKSGNGKQRESSSIVSNSAVELALLHHSGHPPTSPFPLILLYDKQQWRIIAWQ